MSNPHFTWNLLLWIKNAFSKHSLTSELWLNTPKLFKLSNLFTLFTVFFFLFVWKAWLSLNKSQLYFHTSQRYLLYDALTHSSQPMVGKTSSENRLCHKAGIRYCTQTAQNFTKHLSLGTHINAVWPHTTANLWLQTKCSINDGLSFVSFIH